MIRGRKLRSARRVVGLVQLRYRRSLLLAPGGYVCVTVALLLGAAVVNNAVSFTERNITLVGQDVTYYPLFISVAAVSIYLAVYAASSVSRERSDGTLDLLMYGPVTASLYTIGVFVGVMLAGLVLIAAVGLWLAAAAFTLNTGFNFDTVALIVVGTFVVAATVAFGTLVSALTQRARVAAMGVVMVLILLVGLEASAAAINAIQPDVSGGRNDPLGSLRQVVVSLEPVTRWLSPYTQLSNAHKALRRDEVGGYVGSLLTVIIQTALVLTLSARTTERRRAQ